MKIRITLLCFLLGIMGISRAQLLINEIATKGAILNEEGIASDWIEIYNAGPSAVNLLGYGLSDNALNPLEWKFPSVNLDPGAYYVVLADGSGTLTPIDHWETAIYNTGTWKYFVGTAEPPSNWNTPGFSDASWQSGPGGIGYGDGDDNTYIPLTISLYMRQPFTVDDTGAIESAKLDMDYDDGFVAYLNGVEIARSPNITGTPPAYDQTTTYDHEAPMYQGLPPEEFDLSSETVNSLLVPGTNYLCLQIHNVSIGSSDMSSNAWLSFGINSPTIYFGPVPPWFGTSEIYQHTNFKIDNAGETIYLSDPEGNTLDAKFSGAVAYGQSLARIPDASGNWCITTDPSPGTTNNTAECFPGYESDPVFSLAPGFYSGTQTVSISTTSPTAVIHYTLDGSAVTEASPVYAGPITMDTNSVVAARCYSTGGLLPGNMKKNSYFINASDYTLPVISITIDPSSLFDYDTGIYVFGCCWDAGYPYFGANFWQPWQRYAHIEYFDKTGTEQFSKDMDLEIHGGWSRAEPQKSFRINFKNEYDGDLDYRLWSEKPDMGPINNFNLRNSGQHVWADRIQDEFLSEVMRKTHIDYEAYEPCVVFINGEYWGLYEIREKEDEHYVESNYGIDHHDVDLLNGWSTLAGSDTGYVNLYNFVMAANPVTNAFYNEFSARVDVENYVDYYIAEIYYQNVDFGGYYWGLNNIKMWRQQSGGKWRHMLYDLDGAMGWFGSSVYDNYIDLTRNPSNPSMSSQMFDRFLDNTRFRNYFVNRFADLINTIYLQDTMTTIAYAMRDSLAPEMPAHIVRWTPNAPDFATWENYIDNILDYNYYRFFAARAQINSSFALAGPHTITLATDPPGAGYIHINTITPGPLPWTGMYFDGVPVTLTAIPNPGYTFDHWDPNLEIPSGWDLDTLTVNLSLSQTFTAVFQGTPETPQIAVSEINYHSDASLDAGDWVELLNYGTDSLHIGDWQLHDAFAADYYSMPLHTVLGPGQYLVVVEDTAKFKAMYPGVANYTGQFYFHFDNAGDAVTLEDPAGNTMCSLRYADTLPWPPGADGTGRTLEIIDPSADLNNPANWFTGCMLGSPGGPYEPCSDSLVFGEINYHSAADADAGDWAEIWNHSPADISLTQWKFADANDTLLFTFPAGFILPAGQRIVVCGDLAKFTERHPLVTNYTGPFLFGLSSSGEEIRLIDNAGKERLSVMYAPAAPWPAEANGGGKTLELADPGGDMNAGTDWFAGCPEGSPGTAYNPDCPTSVTDELPDPGFDVYPNPADDYIFVGLQPATAGLIDARLQLLDASGRILMDIPVPATSGMFIPRNALPAGFYLLRLITPGSSAVRKFVFR